MQIPEDKLTVHDPSVVPWDQLLAGAALHPAGDRPDEKETL
ncbi:MAG: hypothetical protein ACRDWY_07400 [Actinomycetes bacterium]